MQPSAHPRYRSGTSCPAAGRYQFDGYIDGSLDPTPTPDQLVVALDAGERFPEEVGGPCYWRPQDIERGYDESAAVVEAETGAKEYQ